MRFEDLSLEDQKLIQTDLGSFDKVAAEKVATAQEMYSVGFEKLALETADYLEALYSQEEKVAEDNAMDEESEKVAAEYGAFIEKGFTDGLRKLGQERYGDEMAYFLPFIEEKVAEKGAEGAIKKLWEATKGKVGKGWEAAKKAPGKFPGVKDVREGAEAFKKGKGMAADEGASAMWKNTGKGIQSAGAKQVGKGVAKGVATLGGVGALGYGGYKGVGALKKKED